MYPITDIAPTTAAILGFPAPAQSRAKVIAEIFHDFSRSRRIAILVTDGLGLSAWRKWKKTMTFLQSLHHRRSIVLRSIMPSITPVNFAAMVTGADLAAHGVQTMNSTFACQTVFGIVREAGKKSAGIGLENYTGSNLLGRCADYWGNAGNGSDDDIAEKIIEIATQRSPDYLIAQFGRIDDTFHQYGPSSPSVVPMLRDTDSRLKLLVKQLKQLSYGVIILSDHGQHDVHAAREGDVCGAHGTGSPEDCLVPCTWVS